MWKKIKQWKKKKNRKWNSQSEKCNLLSCVIMFLYLPTMKLVIWCTNPTQPHLNLEPPKTKLHCTFRYFVRYSLSLCDTPISKNTNKWPHSELWNSTFFLLFSLVFNCSGHPSFSQLAKMVAANERVVAVIMVGGPTKGIIAFRSFIHSTILIH